MAKWLLLDGFNLAFRSFYGIPELSRSDGFPTNAIHGFVRTLWYLEDHEKPDRVAIFWDLGGSQERLALMPTYKANRSEPPEAFTLQIPWMKKLSLVLGYALVEEEGVEADDLIASAAIKLKKNGAQVCIVSSDKDLAQILQPGIVQLLPPPTQNPKLGWRKLAYDGVIEKFGVPVEKMVDYLSLMGDSSDNIAGLPGVGPKTAVKWIQEYGSVEGVISKVNYIEPKRFQLVVPKYADRLKINKEMIRLRTHYDVGDMESSGVDLKELRGFFKEMEMHKAWNDAGKRYGEKIRK